MLWALDEGSRGGSMPGNRQGGVGDYGQGWMSPLELKILTWGVSGSHDKLKINGLTGQ